MTRKGSGVQVPYGPPRDIALREIARARRVAVRHTSTHGFDTRGARSRRARRRVPRRRAGRPDLAAVRSQRASPRLAGRCGDRRGGGADRHDVRRPRRGGDRSAAHVAGHAPRARPRRRVGARRAGRADARGRPAACRDGGESTDEVDTPRRAFRLSLVATASNPSTIASWAALFAAASAASVTTTASSTATFLFGIGMGSLGWFIILSSGMAIIRRRAGQRAVQAATWSPAWA